MAVAGAIKLPQGTSPDYTKLSAGEYYFYIKSGSIYIIDSAGSDTQITGATSLDVTSLQTNLLILDENSELTIASGAITVTAAKHTVDTQADASSDDLDTISGTVAGETFILFPNNTARTVVVKNGTDNIITSTGQDITLDETYKGVFCVSDGSNVIACPIFRDNAKLIVAMERQTANTSGGSSSSGVQTRTLNTLFNPSSVSGVSLGSNQLTLPAGKYRIRSGGAPCYKGDRHSCYLYDATNTTNLQDDNSDDITGGSCYAASANTGFSVSELPPSEFTLTSSTAIELRHYIATALATYGLGVETNNSREEIYSWLVLELI